MTTTIRVQEDDFDVNAEMRAMRAANRGIGAVVNFVGLVRDTNEDRTVGAMTLEHYPGMTEKAIAGIIAQAQQRWQIQASTVIHRVGSLEPTAQIVLVAVASAHRGDAFSACEFIMDFLKTKAPFWKKESTPEGQHWVGFRDSDDAAAARWETPPGSTTVSSD